MKRSLVAVGALAVLLAACGGSGGAGVATLEADPGGAIIDEVPAEVSATDEEGLLDFAQCMRDQGLEDFEDPQVNSDGSLEFGFRSQVGEADRDTVRAAFQNCQEHLEGLAFGPGSFDRSEIEDSLVEFAACMRDPERGNLPDFPDPDLSAFGPGQSGDGQGGGGQGGGGPFGGSFDFDDPAVQEALQACQDVFGSLRPGGGSADRPNAGGASDA